MHKVVIPKSSDLAMRTSHSTIALNMNDERRRSHKGGVRVDVQYMYISQSEYTRHRGREPDFECDLCI